MSVQAWWQWQCYLHLNLVRAVITGGRMKIMMPRLPCCAYRVRANRTVVDLSVRLGKTFANQRKVGRNSSEPTLVVNCCRHNQHHAESMGWKRESPDRLVKLQIESPNLNYITVASPQPTHINLNICVARLFWVML